MIVNSSAVNMAAKTTQNKSYRYTKKIVSTNLSTGEKQYTAFMNEGSLLNEKTFSDNKTVLNDKMTSSERKLSEGLRLFIVSLRSRLSLLIGRQVYHYSLNRVNGLFNNNNVLDLSSGGSYQLWLRKNYETVTCEEKNTLSFETTGKAVTADGRCIEFNMQLDMCHSFTSKSEFVTDDIEAVMTDPLVISLDSNPISVSDQKWKFDIDGDGITDEISMLSKGAAYLAYDRDENGRIDSGIELFGAKTGNGFLELSEYDEDGNGWIDENDSIYNKLKVWQKDDSGNDKLIDLKQANVGAIYLGNTKSSYEMKSDKDNTLNAKIRRSGVYLSEGGTAKSVQQLDMVKSLMS